MKILLVADTESRYLWDVLNKNNEKFADVELILSAGDLSSRYLSHIVTILNVPLYYIHGNHDRSYVYQPPEGCVSIDDDVIDFKGVKIAGMGGCREYTGGLFQYSEKEMKKRYKKLRRKMKKGVDIFLTHSPAYELNDGDDLPHKGFEVFVEILDKHAPKLFVHGHQHLNYKRQDREIDYNGTRIVNAHEYVIVEI